MIVKVKRDRHYAVIKNEHGERQTICLNFGKFVKVYETRNTFDIRNQKYTGIPSFYVRIDTKGSLLSCEVPMLIEELTAANKFLEKSEPYWRKK